MSENNFKQQRINAGLSLQDVASVIKIRVSNLRAIEDDDFGSLPEPVYTRGYIKEYAKFLNLSADNKLSAYNAYLNKKKPTLSASKNETLTKNLPNEEHQSTISTQNSKANKTDKNLKGKTLSLKNIVLLIFVVIIAFAGGAFTYITLYTSFSSEDKNTLPPLPSLSQNTMDNTSLDNRTVIDNISSDNLSIRQPLTLVDDNNTKPSYLEPKASKKKMHNLQIIATEKSWLYIKIDNSTGYEKILQPGDNHTVEASRSIYVKIGNAGGVQLKFNGKFLDKLGEKNAVKSIVLPFALKNQENSIR